MGEFRQQHIPYTLSIRAPFEKYEVSVFLWVEEPSIGVAANTLLL